MLKRTRRVRFSKLKTTSKSVPCAVSSLKTISEASGLKDAIPGELLSFDEPRTIIGVRDFVAASNDSTLSPEYSKRSNFAQDFPGQAANCQPLPDLSRPHVEQSRGEHSTPKR
jgi:hypothetical protein